ncbi:MAG TPA: ABC transporter permease [Kofleriaceae bacterium]|nr:ABC transporter permease [Kofleriaceae bacterium]
MTEPDPRSTMTPTAAGAVGTIAAITLRRLLRGRTLWVAGVIALVPVAFGAVLRSVGPQGDLADELLTFQMLVLAVLPPMFIASSIGEEIEDRTITYLWSRPIPRWAVVVGKLLALAPPSVALVVVSWHLGCSLGLEAVPPLRSHLALAGAAAVVSAIATGIAVLVPRHGMALTIGYMLLDFWLGIMPASIQNLSVLHHVLAISFPPPEGSDVLTAAIWMAVVGGGWLGAGLWRIRGLEA